MTDEQIQARLRTELAERDLEFARNRERRAGDDLRKSRKALDAATEARDAAQAELAAAQRAEIALLKGAGPSCTTPS